MLSCAFIQNLGMPELILILVVVLIVFGPGKLPEAGRAIGKAINEFKKASSNVKSEINEVIKTDTEEEDKGKKE